VKGFRQRVVSVGTLRRPVPNPNCYFVEFLMKTKLLAILSLVLMSGFVTAHANEPKTIAEIVAGSKDHTILLALVKEAKLVDVLNDGEWTVFAPTDAAFKKIDKETLNKVKGDKELLKKILTSHAVKGTVLAADVVKLDGKEVTTVSGAKFKVKVDGKTVKIGDAKVIQADIKAKNGVVHVIDTVLIPK
jgi:uncharacterized surface protein with fasciclin (FAS1) repeats